MLLALFGVSNGAIQFMSYEELKRWRQEVKRRKVGTGTGRGEEDWKALVSPLPTERRIGEERQLARDTDR